MKSSSAKKGLSSTKSHAGGTGAALPYAVGIFTSAYLLFQIQPMIARYILPWFGGGPGVWTVCMMFFQLSLLSGYLYAHLLANRLAPARQAQLHLCLLAVSLFALPITTAEGLRPDNMEHPALAIVFVLIFSVGVPFIVVSASGPLLQHWFSLSFPGRSPYRLYALSNAGSLLGLLAYPFVVEPSLGLTAQTQLWSGLYFAYAMLCLLCAWPLLSSVGLKTEQPHSFTPSQPSSASRLPMWVALSGCGSTVLLATTNQISLAIAAFPFLWIVPLALYLLSFILCFESSRWYRREVWVPFLIVSYTALVYMFERDLHESSWSLFGQASVYSSVLFSSCMVCHGELARRKPLANELTSFYLAVALGGAAGGLFVNLLAPLLFKGFWELHVSLVTIALLVGWCIWRDRRIPSKSQQVAYLFGFGAWTLALGVTLGMLVAGSGSNLIERVRDFYGVFGVYEFLDGSENDRRWLDHGGIAHGVQFLGPDRRFMPTTYYDWDSGAGIAILTHPRFETHELKIGSIGLGVGTIATFGREGDEYRFYEINPEIERVAREHFTYLSNTAAEIVVVLGDARISLENELRRGKVQNFDTLIVDAFSGDAIPVHLLTREAFALYWKHLKPDGVLAIHISNIHFDLADVVRTLAKDVGKEAVLVFDDGRQSYGLDSDWVLISSNRAFLEHPAMTSRIWQGWEGPLENEVRWTDDYSNLFGVIKRN